MYRHSLGRTISEADNTWFTFYGESICTGKRESASKPYAGPMSVHSRALNAEGDECPFDRIVLVYKRSHAAVIDSFPEAKSGPLTLPAKGQPA